MGNGNAQTWQALLQRMWISMSIRMFDHELPQLFQQFLASKPSNDEEIKLWFESVPLDYWATSNSSAYHIAAHQASPRIIEYLLSAGFRGIDNTDYINKLTPLGIAIKKYNKRVAQSLLNCGASIHHGLLSYTVMSERYDIVRMLVQAGADVNSLSERHYNPLHLLVFVGKCKRDVERENIAKLLLQSGCDVNKLNMNGDSPLHLAISNDYFEIANVFLDARADVTLTNDHMQSPLHLSIIKRRVELSKRIVEMEETDLNVADLYNKTPLCYAIEVNSVEICQMLVDNGASPDFSEMQEFYPLHEAIRLDNGKLVDFLMDHCTGVDLLEIRKDHLMHKGLTCLQLAALYGRERIFTKLLQHGADISAKSDDGLSVLYYASLLHQKNVPNFTDYPGFMRTLISKGAGFDLSPCDELAVLSYVVSTSDVETLRFFISICGFQIPKYSLFDYYKLLSYLAEYKFIRRVLKDYIGIEHFDINAKDEYGRGLVYYATLTENTACLKYLLKLKANADCKDVRNGDTPLHVAIKHGNVECVKLLLFYNFHFGLRENLPLNLAVLFHICSNDREIVAHYIIRYAVIQEILDYNRVDLDEAIESHENLKHFLDACRRELKIMQNSIVYDSVSIFDVLLHADRYSRNRYVVQEFDGCDDMLSDFCIYGNILVNQFKRARKRPFLIQQAESGLAQILRRDSKSFAVIFDNIFKFLRNKDLRMLKLV